MCQPAVDLRIIDDLTDPDLYKSTKYYRQNSDVEDIYKSWDQLVADPTELANLTMIVNALIAAAPRTGRELEQALSLQRKQLKLTYRKAQLLHAYHLLVGNGEVEACPELHALLVKKSAKSQSGCAMRWREKKHVPIIVSERDDRDNESDHDCDHDPNQYPYQYPNQHPNQHPKSLPDPLPEPLPEPLPSL